MDTAEFIARLKVILSDGEGSGRRLASLFSAEAMHSETSAYTLIGYATLAEASKYFFFQTIDLLNSETTPKVQQPLPAMYPFFIERMVHYFRSLRAAELTSGQGYPMHGYTLLRNIFDSVILTSAVALGKTDFQKLEGLNPDGTFDRTTYRKQRRKEEEAVRLVMTGKTSELSSETLDELAAWDVLFDHETHGGVLTRAHTTDWLRGSKPLSLVPEFSENIFALFVNRYCEISWMTHRLLPLIQPQGLPFAQPWKDKWASMDKCYQSIVESLSTQLNKKIGRAIVELVNSKFPFNENSTYWDKG